MNKSIFALLTFLIVGGFAFFVQKASAQNAVPFRDTLQATLITDSAKKLYELRKQRSLKRFGPRCQVNENGLPKYCDDVKVINRRLLARNDTTKAWQFIKINKKALGIENPESEVRLIPLDYYGTRKDTTVDFYYFQEMVKDFEVGGYGYKIAFNKRGEITYFEGGFLPEVKHVDVSGCISEEKARKIALSDTIHAKEIPDRYPKDVLKFRKVIYWNNGNYSLEYEIDIVVDWLYHYNINPRTGELHFVGVAL